MHRKMRFIRQVFAFLLLTLFFSCNRGDDKGLNTSAKSSNENQSASTLGQLSNLPVQTKAQDEPEIKDYKGIPWGLDFDEFRKIKPNIDKPAWKVKYFLSENGENRDSLIAICLGAPVEKDFIGLRNADFSLFPEKFYSVYDGEIHYIFYNDNFSMVFTYIANYDELYNKLSQNYTKTDTIDNAYTNLKNVRTFININATQFRKGHQSYYLINMTENDGFTRSSGYLLIIPDKNYGLIKKDMEAIQNERAKKATEYKKKEVQNDLDKLR